MTYVKSYSLTLISHSPIDPSLCRLEHVPRRPDVVIPGHDPLNGLTDEIHVDRSGVTVGLLCEFVKVHVRDVFGVGARWGEVGLK